MNFDYVQAQRPHPCTWCQKETWKVEICFEAFLCSQECANKLEAAYWEATNGR